MPSTTSLFHILEVELLVLLLYCYCILDLVIQYLNIITHMKKLQTAIIMLTVLILLPHTLSQPACYVSCSKEGCLASNSTSCTKCDAGFTVLMNSRCIIIGPQSEPLRYLSPNRDLSLDISRIQDEYKTRQQIQCTSTASGQSGIITYLNVTRNQQQVYTVRLPMINLDAPHQFVNVKFNAILFNAKPNPSLKVLIIDDKGDRIYDSVIKSNEPAYSCRSRPASNAFYVTINLSTSSSTLLFQLTTLDKGDELGLSDFNFYYGNCDIGCSKCQGPAGNQCLACKNLLAYSKDIKSCVACPSRFYNVNSICYPCPYNCETCAFNLTTGVAICTKCETRITGNAQLPDCSISIFIDRSFYALRFNDSLDWKSSSTISNLTTVCGAYSLLGGLPSGLGGSILSTIYTDLPVHRKAWIKFTLFLIDQVSGSEYNAFIDVDGTRVLNFTTTVDSSIMATSECGEARQEYISTIIIPDITHNKSTASISIQGLSNYFGIRDFVFGVVNITSDFACDDVNTQNVCIRCKNGFAVTAPNETVATAKQICTTCPNGYYEEDRICKVCPITCKTCISSSSLPICTSCDAPLKYDDKSGTCNDPDNNLYTVALSQKWAGQTNQNWVIYPRLQTGGSDSCGDYSILGSTELLYRELSMKRVWNSLPNHQGVSLQFYLYQIDDNTAITFKLGNQIIPYIPSNVGFNMCGNSTFDSIKKVVLNDANHQGQTVSFEVLGNRTKLGLSNMLLFLTNCLDCKNNGVSYELETIPMYSVDAESETYDRGMFSKITFSEKIETNTDIKNLFEIKLENMSSIMALNQAPINNSNETKAKGERGPFQILNATLFSKRRLELLQNLIKDEYGKGAVARLITPDSVYGFTKVNGDTFIKSLRLKPVTTEFSRYDDLHSDITGASYRANIRNLMNLFRGVSILALFIGLVSFFFGLSDLFDDLFLMCQIIFVHIFIQSSWIAPSMKLPVGAMNMVQFMAWLPFEGRLALEKAIIPSDHYQRSPIVYQQYWKDISFARAIYHTIIFLVVMVVLYWLIRLVKALREPSINGVLELTRHKYSFIESSYYKYVRDGFVYIDRVFRFSFFTVMWACCLQFINFYVEPTAFMGWNAALCIVMFIGYIAYVAGGFFYLRNQASFTQETTFKEKFDGIRIKKSELWYFIFKYTKLLVIVFLIGQLYAINPLATLIPLMAIHLTDGLLIILKNPFIEDSGESERIVSKCTKSYWVYYRISHIIENFLFLLLELVMIIMYAIRTTALKPSYMSAGYACCAFIIFLFCNSLVRLIWGFVHRFEVYYDEVKGRAQEVETDEQIDPLKFLDLFRANANADPQLNQRQGRRPSIEMGV